MSHGAAVLPNVGGEEGEWRRHADEPRVAAVAGLFRGLFEEPLAFPWLDAGPHAAFAWWVDDAAVAWAREAGRALQGPPASVVRTVHDKAFAARLAEAEGLLPEPLRGLVEVLDSEALSAAGAADSLLARVAAWPAWTGGRFTLKPRLGTSARGRVGGVAGADGTPADRLAAELPRLAARGGAVLEPWLERRGDFSVQLYLHHPERAAGQAPVVLLGSLVQCTRPSGRVDGHRGRLDARGRVSADAAWEASAVEAALAVALEAHAAGYHGPCGVDGFAFAGPDGRTLLRPVVELNARFTVGTLAVASTRRALPRARAELGLGPGRLVHFGFSLSDDGRLASGAERLRIPLAAGEAPPCLWLARTPDALDGLCAGAPPASAGPGRDC